MAIEDALGGDVGGIGVADDNIAHDTLLDVERTKGTELPGWKNPLEAFAKRKRSQLLQ